VSDLTLVILVAVITYATRLSFMLRPRPAPGGALGRFLDVFPLALFVSLAAVGMVAPNGALDLTPALAAAAGGVLGAVLFKRNLWGVLGVGAALFYLTRAMVG
jgi:branched-subunit amino acid transport protein